MTCPRTRFELEAGSSLESLPFRLVDGSISRATSFLAVETTLHYARHIGRFKRD
jgi:hypothetical protein